MFQRSVVTWKWRHCIHLKHQDALMQNMASVLRVMKFIFVIYIGIVPYEVCKKNGIKNVEWKRYEEGGEIGNYVTRKSIIFFWYCYISFNGISVSFLIFISVFQVITYQEVSLMQIFCTLRSPLLVELHVWYIVTVLISVCWEY